jgi:hypothetical protein
MEKKPSWGKAPYLRHCPDGTAKLHLLKGRPRWALEALIDAGPKGCTPIDNPAPRWSGYIHVLRELGFEIETLHEPHGPPFAGTHGRYILKGHVTRGIKVAE